MLHQSRTELRDVGVGVRAGISGQSIWRWAEEEPREEGVHPTNLALPYHIICYNLPEDATAGFLDPVDYK